MVFLIVLIRRTVHIVHGGDKAAKQAVREISTELEDGFQLMDPTKYKLYNRIQGRYQQHLPISIVYVFYNCHSPFEIEQQTLLIFL